MSAGIGILGFAHGHVHSYCRNWRENPGLGVTPVAGWDHDGSRLAKAASDHGLAACDSVDSVLGRSDVTAVVVSSETSMHAELVEQAAAAGKTIILQKPMALTLAEADRIVDAVSRHGVRFTMAWQMRVDPQNLKMKALIEDGSLGQIMMVRRRHGLPVCLNPGFRDSWHVAPDKNRDIWADDASHPIDFVFWLFGEPESVTAELASLYDPAMPMDTGIAVFRYAGGPLVEVTCAFANPACENTTEIIGSKGSVVQNFGDGPSCNVPRPDGAPGLKWFLREANEWTISDLPTPPNHGHRIAGLAEPLAAFVLGNAGPVATVEEGRTALRMLLACYVSTREGRRVALDDAAVAAV